MGKLDGKVSVVTGASSGIGLAIAKALGAEGANVVLSGRKRQPMDEAAKAISSDGAKAVVRQSDVRDEKQMAELIDSAVAEFRKLDIMVNNAGVNPFDNVLEGDVQKWRDTLETNVIGLALGCREAYRVMKGKGGHIVNVTSVAARYAEPDGPMYAASKHAAGALTESLRLALQGKGIRVTAIMPGAVATNLGGNMVCGVMGDEIMARVGPERYDAALATPGAKPMDFTGRPMTGMITITGVGLETDEAWRAWLDQALSYARSLPAK